MIGLGGVFGFDFYAFVFGTRATTVVKYGSTADLFFLTSKKQIVFFPPCFFLLSCGTKQNDSFFVVYGWQKVRFFFTVGKSVLIRKLRYSYDSADFDCLGSCCGRHSWVMVRF